MVPGNSSRGAGQPSGRGFYFGVEIGNDVLKCGDRLLYGGNLHQFPAVDRTVAVLQRDDQIPPLLLELDQRQTVIRQMSHYSVPALCVRCPFDRTAQAIPDQFCHPFTKLRQILAIDAGRPALPLRRSVNNW